jgi:hypothetical protein
MMVEVWRGLPSSDETGFEKIKDFPNIGKEVDKEEPLKEEPLKEEPVKEVVYPSLRLSSTGIYVKMWQTFLIGQACYSWVTSEVFDKKTKTATEMFQKKIGEKPDGWAGPVTQKRATEFGWNPYPKVPPVIVQQSGEDMEDNFPPYPSDLKPLTSTSERMRLFGIFKYRSQPTKDNPEAIKVLDNWETENLVKISIPQLKKILGDNAPKYVIFHKLGAYQLASLWNEWDKAGLLDRIKTYDDSYVPRFVRGSTSTLSNHAFGSAFDINADLNPLGSEPLAVGEEGSVRELVKIANKWGFFWGGHFGGRPDGMHFEIAKIISKTK